MVQFLNYLKGRINMQRNGRGERFKLFDEPCAVQISSGCIIQAGGASKMRLSLCNLFYPFYPPIMKPCVCFYIAVFQVLNIVQTRLNMHELRPEMPLFKM